MLTGPRALWCLANMSQLVAHQPEAAGNPPLGSSAHAFAHAACTLLARARTSPALQAVCGSGGSGPAAPAADEAELAGLGRALCALRPLAQRTLILQFFAALSKDSGGSGSSSSSDGLPLFCGLYCGLIRLASGLSQRLSHTPLAAGWWWAARR